VDGPWQKSPARIGTKDGELRDEQLNEVSGGIVITKRMDIASPKLAEAVVLKGST
jgi:type VI protein secretion system component Hcp